MNAQQVNVESIMIKSFPASQPFIAHSTQMKNILSVIKKVSCVPTTVLITGESGVGKEQVANNIYRLSKRRDKPFIKLNCGAIPESLIESELFGYKKGAFTGADPNGKVGYFTQANHGIIFLDEITELPLNMQVKLLRVLQEREVTPIGATQPIPIDIQIIAATNKDLRKLVKEGSFREDLYYRLNVMNIKIPPLREREEDIPYLIDYFLEYFNHLYDKDVYINNEAMELIKDYPWYGNVREVKNLIERMVVIAESQIISADEIHFFLPSNDDDHSDITVSNILPLQEALDTVEEKLIMMAIDKYKSISLAAKALGITQPTMSRKYKRIKEQQGENRSKSMTNKEIFEAELDNHLQSITTVIASSINVDKVKILIDNPTLNNPVYEELQKNLTQIRINEGKIQWSYIWKIDSSNKVINLVSDERLKLLPREEYTGPPEMLKVIFEGINGKVVVSSKYTDKFGQWKTCISPITDNNQNIVAILGVDFSVEYIDNRTNLLKKLLN